MKIAEYNDMMAHLTRRQKFSNGGDAILPQPNPLSSQERNQKVFNDYVGRMKKYLGAGVNMPEWFVKDLIFKKAEELGVELKADGGRIGLRAGAGTAGGLPFLVRGMSRPGVHKAWTKEKLAEALMAEKNLIGAAAASGALAFRPRDGEDIDELTHKSVPVDTGEGVYIGDRGEKAEEKERIAREEKKKYDEIKWGKREEFNVPTHTGHPPLPPEKWTPPDTIPPQIKTEPEGFPIPKQKTLGDYILYQKKAEKIEWPASIHPDQKQKVTEVLDKQKKKIPELKTKEDYERFITDVETSGLNHKNKPLVLTDEYKEALKHYVETFHDSNVSRAIKNIPLNNQSLGARLKGTDFMAKGSHSKSILDIEVGDKTFSEAMNDLQHNYEPAMAQIKKKLKDAGISLEDYAHGTDLANIVGIDSKNIEQRDQLLKKMRLFFEPIRGEDNTYHIGDFLEKISSYIKDTRYDITREGIKPGQQYIERVEKINPGLKELKTSASGKINRKLKASGFELVDSDGRTISLKDHMGHVESTDVMSKYPKIFEDSDAESIQTLLNQDRVVNIDILVDRGYHTKNDAIYKGVTDGTMTIKEANQKLKDNHERIVKIIKGKAKELPYFKNKEKSVALMQIGKNGKITVDMSTIDKQYIYGKINEINPTATKVSDLSKEEKELYESNLRDQYVDSAYNFLTNMKDDKGDKIYSRDEIADFLDEFYTKNTYKYRMQKGGPVYGKYAKQIAGIS